MQLLKDKEYSEYTIIGIGLECGFNSKSSFYREFYEIAKTTPSEYRKLA